MISKQTKVLILVCGACFVSGLTWQSYWRLGYGLSHLSVGARGGEWDLGTLWVHQPLGCDILLLIGSFRLLLAASSLISDIKRSPRDGSRTY